MGAQEFVQFTGWKDQEQSFANGLGTVTLRTVKLAGGKSSELLPHKCQVKFASTRRMSRSTLTGVWVASMVLTKLEP